MNTVHKIELYLRQAAPHVRNREHCALLAEAAEELDITNKLLAERERVLNAIPECPTHGSMCVPHALDWVEASKRKIDNLVANCEAYACEMADAKLAGFETAQALFTAYMSLVNELDGQLAVMRAAMLLIDAGDGGSAFNLLYEVRAERSRKVLAVATIKLQPFYSAGSNFIVCSGGKERRFFINTKFTPR